jgi:phosphate transport system substrate-binding protein
MRGLTVVPILAFSLATSCQNATVPAGSDKPISIQGAGATFPYPLYSKWVAEYQKRDPRVRVNYQSIGSGGGIRQVTEQTVDFGASDAPMTDPELAKAPGKLVHIPTTLGAVVLAFNLPGIEGLTLSPEIVAGLFLGDIKSWNDPQLARLNPGVALPSTTPMVTYRADGSGTTAVFTEYLSKVSPIWRDRVGVGKSVKFPVGLGAKGNEGVAGQLKTTPGTIGYLELAYAKQAKITFAKVTNREGTAVVASPETVTAAAASVSKNLPEDLRVSIVDPAGATVYPISSFTYILVYEDQRDATKGKALAQFLWWAVHEGQALAPGLDYAPLPAEVVTRVEAKLKSLRTGSTGLL